MKMIVTGLTQPKKKAHELEMNLIYRFGASLFLSYDPYGPASAFFAKSLMKVPYEGRTHLHERGRKKPYGPTTKAYGLAC